MRGQLASPVLRGAQVSNDLRLLDCTPRPKRVRDANDRRRMCVHLTPKGRRLRDEMMPEVSAMVFRSTANVTPSELDTFFKVIKRIEANLVAEGGNVERGVEW